MKVYPNPAEDNINIEYPSTPYQVTIFNTLGVKVYDGNSVTNSLENGVGQFKRGFYLIKLTDSNNEVNVQKIILK
jgi:hypothetical protein